MNISENFDRWMFDYKEGNLSAADAEKFESFLLNHPEFDADADAWDMAFVADQPVVYPNAHKLEKKRRVIGWYYWGAAAAVIAVLSITTTWLISGSVDEVTLQNSQLDMHGSRSNKWSAQSNQVISERFANLFADITGNSPSDQNQQYAQSLNSDGTINLSTNNNFVNQPENNGEDELMFNRGNYAYHGNESLVNSESEKMNGDQDAGKYRANPAGKNLNFEIQKGSNQKNNSRSISVFRKIYKKIDRMLGYPVGLTNLRDPELLLPQSSLLSFNSAFTGGMLKPRFEMTYRNQWLGSEQNSQELNISFDNYLYSMRGGIGLMITAQDYGMGQFGDYNASLIYSPKLVVSRNFMIEPSVKFTMGSMIANGDKLPSSSLIEMDRGRTLQTVGDNEMGGITHQWYKDYGLGLVVNTKWFYAGFSADNLSRHYENVYGNDLSSPSETPVRLSGIIGTDYVSNQKTMTYSPFVAYQQFGNKPEFWGGMNYRAGWFTIGGAVSTNREFTASAGIHFETFKFVYHYDYTESAIMQNKYGSHNIGIRFNAKRKNQRLTH
ncbi:MAG: type IX secretion system membrane protein PorP/SprF [Crocinitomicaceae bacterium]|nr:type IX secretion system membrane protein PorP/SprF [Crocinitomicaceae bacterium]MBK8926186.1 type IX secretion system membrane protein PorP/SprF [Crocinitomicaceae bacterium]